MDYTRIKDTADFLNQPFHSREIVSFVTGFVDTVLAAQTAAVAAKSLGIDSLFTNSIHRVNLQTVYDTLALPREDCFPVIELVLGYPDREPEYQKGRLSGKGIVHYGRYRRLSREELKSVVAEYDDGQRHLGMNDDWAKLGFAHYLDWFYEKWCGEIPVEKQREFYKALAGAGFLRSDLF